MLTRFVTNPRTLILLLDSPLKPFCSCHPAVQFIIPMPITDEFTDLINCFQWPIIPIAYRQAIRVLQGLCSADHLQLFRQTKLWKSVCCYN